MPNQAEKAQATRRRLLDAAFESLVELGYFGTSTVKVAERAGVARGTMLHHYPTKDALVLATLEDILMKRVQDFEAQLVESSSTDAATLLKTLWQALKGPTFQAWLELAVASRTQSGLAEEFRSLMRRFDTRVMNLVERELPSSLAAPLDLKFAVGIGFSALNGFALDLLQMTEEEADHKVDSAIAFLVTTLNVIKQSTQPSGS